MKKVLLSALAVASYITVNAQCTDVFISEYVEGTGNNKALELFNPSLDSISLNNYRLVRYGNGTDSATASINTTVQVMIGNIKIGPHSTLVIALDKRDPAGTGQDVPIDAGLEAVADIFLCPNYNVSDVMYFNGNDALGLQKTLDGGTTWLNVDIFAQIGDAGMTGNNGSGGWQPDFPYNNGSYTTPIAWTLNHTLRRHADVEKGVVNNPNPFMVGVEWDSIPVNTFTGLGTHTCNCPLTGVSEINKEVAIKLFPNPVNDNHFTISAAEKIAEVKVFTATGQEVISVTGNKSATQLEVETGSLAKGMYIVKVLFTNNRTSVTKLSVK